LEDILNLDLPSEIKPPLKKFIQGNCVFEADPQTFLKMVPNSLSLLVFFQSS